jgi:hypothetical protein
MRRDEEKWRLQLEGECVSRKVDDVQSSAYLPPMFREPAQGRKAVTEA